MKDAITCEKCHGKGEVPLPWHLRETLAQVPKRGGITAVEIHPKFIGITINAVSNRLNDLFRLSLVRRERFGKFWRYSR